MTQQEVKAVEDAANEQVPTDSCAFFHYSDADIWKEGFIAGAQFLDTLRKASEPDKELLEALEQIANAPVPFDEFEYCAFVLEARRIACEAISNYEKLHK